MLKQIEDKMNELNDLCMKHHVESLFIFGSATTSSFKTSSDIDFLVQFESSIDVLNYGDNFFSFQEELEKLYNRKIDLISAKSVKNPILKKQIEASKVLLYAA